MALKYKILGSIAILLAAGLGTLAVVASRDAACGPPPVLASDATPMKAIVYRCYGSSEVLKLENIEKPIAGDDQLLVKVHAASVNPLDWHYMRGKPYLMRMESGFGTPESPLMGVDFAGTVEAVGKNVKRFKPGDEVFGGRNGAFAEYLRVREIGPWR